MRKLVAINNPNANQKESSALDCSETWLDKLSYFFIERAFRKLQNGTITVTFPDGHTRRIGAANREVNQRQPHAKITLHTYKLFWKLIKDGGIGFGESFVDGDWSTDDLLGVLAFFLNSEGEFKEKDLHLLKPLRFLSRIQHFFRSNSKDQAKINISEHYDLGNNLFAEFLDSSMTYSSARYTAEHNDLHSAQLNKIRTVLRKAQAKENDTVLEIGCGWGELSSIAAKEFGCTVKGITLSAEQATFAKDKVKQFGVERSVDIDLCDYRDVKGTFDKIISIEMIEAVGNQYLGDFFSVLDRVLSPTGVVVLQVIAYPDAFYKEYLERQDWIQKHIFPGSHLPSFTSLCDAMTSHSNLVIDSVENISNDYARTLHTWRETFNERKLQIQLLGYDKRFQRAWNYYLAACEAEFSTRWLSLYQIVLTRPNNNEFGNSAVADATMIKEKAVA